MYGYADDSSKRGDFTFGLNQRVKMTKFEYNSQGGAGNTEGDCIDVEFSKGDSHMRMRLFPVTKAFEGKTEITDPKHPAFQAAIGLLNSTITHILSRFIDKDELKKAFATPIASFKQYANISAALLPKNFSEIDLDLFLQYEWQLSGNNEITFLQIPKNFKQGPWLAVSEEGTFTQVRKENPDNTDQNALTYVNEEGVVHSIKRNGWFVNSNFATQQRAESSGFSNSSASSTTGTADW